MHAHLPVHRAHTRTPNHARVASRRQARAATVFASTPQTADQLRSLWRPRVLDRLLRAAANAQPKPDVLLPLLDELVYELKQVSMPAMHCSQRHSDINWRAAGAEVYSACSKYEQFFLKNKGLYRKLCEAERRAKEAAQSVETDQKSAELLQLAQTLRHLFERRGGAAVRDEFSTSHFALAHVPDTEDPAWQDCLHIERAERQMADGVRVCVSCAAASPVLPLVYVEDWPEVCGGSGHEASSNTHPSSSGNAPTSLDEEGHSDSSLPPWSTDPILQPLLRRTPNLHTTSTHPSADSSTSDNSSSKMSARDAAAAGWGAVLLLDSVATSQVLTHHPNPHLRKAVYELGLQPRVEAALGLRSRMWHARSAIACAHHAPSYAHLMLGSRQQGEGNAETAEDSNAESSRGAADGTQHRDRSQEEATDSGLDAGSSDEGHMQQGRVAAAEQLLSCCLHAVRGAADKHVRNMAATLSSTLTTDAEQGTAAGDVPSADVLDIQPWNVSYAQQQLLISQGLDVQYKEVEEHMSLLGIVEGLSQVLQGSMGLRLRTVPATDSSGSSAPDDDREDHTDIWDAGVIRLVLESCDEGASSATGSSAASSDKPSSAHVTPLGLCLLDPGGSYGTRQLRFVRRAAGLVNSKPASSRLDWDALPVVSVGLQQPWQKGRAGKLDAMVELLHELGHAVHLLASSYAAPYKLFGGLHLPLETLEVPSLLFERFLTDPRTLRVVCCKSSQDCGEGFTHIDPALAQRLALYFKARHSSALDFQEQVMLALCDHLLNASGQQNTHDSADDLLAAIREQHSSLGLSCTATLKQLSSLPITCHHQATFWVYVSAWCNALRLWEQLEPDPLGCTAEGKAAGRALRRGLLEAGACAATNEAVAYESGISSSDVLDGCGLLADQDCLERWLYCG